MKIVKMIGSWFVLIVFACSTLHAQKPVSTARELDEINPMNDARVITPATRLPNLVQEVLSASVVDVLVKESSRSNFAPAGLGIFVGPSFILTRYHVIDPSEHLANAALVSRRVKIVSGGDFYDASVVYYDKNADLLLLHAPDARGTPVLISSYPLDPRDGRTNYFSFGCGFDDRTEYYVEHYQFYGYAPAEEMRFANLHITGVVGTIEGLVRPGFSGSPLVDESGVVRGDVLGYMPQSPKTIFTPGSDMLGFVGVAMHFVHQHATMHYARSDRPALR